MSRYQRINKRPFLNGAVHLFQGGVKNMGLTF